MAIYTPSALISEIRGSVGDVNYSRNRYGPFVRSKLTQTNPDTVFQQLRRAALTAANAAYKDLTDEEHKQWLAYVQEHTQPGRLPGRTKLSAWNEFAGRYVNRSLVGGSITDFSPYPSVRKFPWITGVATGPGSLSISFDSNEETGFIALVVYASALMSPAVRSLNRSWCRVIMADDVSTKDGTIELYDEYILRLPYIGDPNGQRIFVGLKAVNTDNYAASECVYSSVIVSGWEEVNDTFDETFDETFL